MDNDRGTIGMFDTLIAPRQLAALLGDPHLTVIDCRFELARPAWGEQEYVRARIPHARYAHLDRDLSGALSATTGRHPLPPAHRLAVQLGRWGIDARSQVVAYDQGPGAFAARLWWLLRWLGHRRVAVLDGGLAAWRADRLPLERQSAGSWSEQVTRFAGRPDEAMVAATAEIEQLISSGGLARRWVLADARAPERFAGRKETLDAVAGHVPGARNVPFAGNLREGRFLAPDELRERFTRVLSGQPAESLISMCGSGVTACHNLLALEAAGMSGGRLYAGSWSEWIRDPARPIARGST